MKKSSTESEKVLMDKLTGRISSSKQWRDSIAQQQGWERFEKEYRGIYDVTMGGMTVPPINEVFAYVKTSISNFFKRVPYTTVNPNKNSTILGAYIWEALINSDWKTLKIKPQVEACMTDAMLVGHSWMKTGTNFRLMGEASQPDDIQEQTYSRRCPWRDVFFNIGSLNPPFDSQWIANRIYRPTEFIKKEYGARARDLQGVAHPSSDRNQVERMLYKDDILYSSVIEMMDAQERKTYLFAEENGKLLQDPMDWPDWRTDFPYDMLAFNLVNEFPYPMSDIAPWEPQVLEKIKLFTMSLNHTKRLARQMLMRKGGMSPQDREKFQKGIDGSILEVNGDPMALTKTVDFGSLPPDVYIILDRLDAQIRSVNGQPEFDRGGTTNAKTRTLGELSLMEEGAKGRTNLKLDAIETFCESISKRLMQERKNSFNMENVVKITGNEPEVILKAFGTNYDPVTRTIRFSPEDIAGDYDVSILSGSTLPLDKQNRDSVLDAILQQSIQLAAYPSLPPFIGEVVKERLRGFGLKSIEQAFDAQQQQQAEARAQQSQEEDVNKEKVRAETAKRAAQANEITIDTEIKKAVAGGKASGAIPMDMKVTS